MNNDALYDRLTMAIARHDAQLAESEARLDLPFVLDAAARRIAALEAKLARCGEGWAIALDERNRAEMLAGELAARLDLACAQRTSGTARPAPVPRSTPRALVGARR
ncbi:MAG TPA: hypothetical protein VNL16_07935 [Chloroflexota bacterium]|nr:hypothetical protein [Chloroflexota bacterium]